MIAKNNEKVTTARETPPKNLYLNENKLSQAASKPSARHNGNGELAEPIKNDSLAAKTTFEQMTHKQLAGF